jgi:hypothetical protein
MRKPMIISLVMLAAVGSISLHPSAAAIKVQPKPKTKIVSARYDLAMIGFTDTERDPTGGSLKGAFPADGSYDIGGVTLPALGGLGKAKIYVTAKDDIDLLGTHLVWINVCQDLNGNMTCGEAAAHEPSIFGCVSPTKGLLLPGIDRRKPVIVFVYTASGCPKYNTDTSSFASATMGTIKGVYTY